MNALAVIGGTGMDRPEDPAYRGEHRLKTPYGAPSAPVQEGEWAGCKVFYLQRHGEERAIPPHRINYRANLWALRELGVREVIAVLLAHWREVRWQPVWMVSFWRFIRIQIAPFATVPTLYPWRL